jgi:putative chitinase
MSYLDTLNTEQKNNIALITEDAKKIGITNPYAIAGILAIISKESSFVPKQERAYSGTSNERIRKVFGSRLSGYSESQLSALKANPKAFFDAIYGGRYNNAQDEGYKYRGRGFNQITFKSAYERYAKDTGEDLVNNPDLMLKPKTASKVAVAFAKRRIQSLKDNGKLASYNANDINDFKNTKDATMAMYHANTGAGKSVAHVKGLATSDHLGGMRKALDRVNDLLIATKTLVKKKPLMTVLITTAIVFSVWALIKYSGIAKKNKTISKLV